MDSHQDKLSENDPHQMIRLRDHLVDAWDQTNSAAAKDEIEFTQRRGVDTILRFALGARKPVKYHVEQVTHPTVYFFSQLIYPA